MFWKVEDTPSAETTHTKNEQIALDHFGWTHKQIEDGRYTIELSRKSDDLSLGCSRDQAQRRHFQNQKSLIRKGK